MGDDSVETDSTVIRSVGDLMAALDVSDPAAIEDTLDTDTDVVLTGRGIELRDGRMWHALNYPFQLAELDEVIDEIESGEDTEDEEE